MNEGIGFGDGLLAAIGVITAVLVAGVLILAVVVLVRHRANAIRAGRAAERRTRWEPVLLDVLAGDRPPAEVGSVVQPGEERSFCEFLQEYGRRLAGVDLRLLLAAAQPYLWAIREDLVSRSPEVRAGAVQMLSELGFSDHLMAVVEGLDDPSPVVAAVAAQALTRPGHPELAAEVVDRLNRFAEWDQGFMAALVASSGPGIAAKARQALADVSRQGRERAISADALRLLSDPDAAGVAADALARTEDPEVANACLRLLRQVGRSEHAAVVRQRAADGEFATRAHALSTLGAIGEQADARLAELALLDPSPWVALHAGRALISLGEFEPLESLAHQDGHRQDLALELLGEVEA